MKKILFLFLLTFSFSAHSGFYAEKCGASCSTVVNTFHYCYVNNVLVDPDAGKNCRYRGGISGNYYACCSGNDWNLFDVDSDGFLNGADLDPYDPDIPNAPDDPIDDNGDCTNDIKTLKYSIIDTDLNGQAYYSKGNNICYYEILSETPIANSNCKLFDLQGTGIALDASTPSGGTSCSCDSGYSEQGESCVLDAITFLNPTISFPDSVDEVHYKILACFDSLVQVKATHRNFKSNNSTCPDGTFDPDKAYTFDEMFDVLDSAQIRSYAKKRFKASFNSDTSLGAMFTFHNIAYGLTDTRLGAFLVTEKDGANQYPRVMECNQFNGVFETETGFVGTWDDAANNKFCPGFLIFRTVEITEEEDPDPDPGTDPGTDPPVPSACNAGASNYATCIGINPRLDDIKEILEDKNNDDLIAAIEALDFSSGSGGTNNPTNPVDMAPVVNAVNDSADRIIAADNQRIDDYIGGADSQLLSTTQSWQTQNNAAYSAVIADQDGLINSTVDSHKQIGTGMLDGLKDSLNNLIPSSTGCTSLTVDFMGKEIVISCEDTKVIRDFLGWIFYVYTAFFLMDLVVNPARSKV